MSDGSDELLWKNKLYFGDNLNIMRDYIADESVDLIYLDPPFNSKATYNVLFAEKDGKQSPAQITAFEDTWHWDMSAARAYEELVTSGPGKLADLIQALRGFLGTNDMMAYLTMMAIRFVEMRRVLKETGSIYLHCDPTASHYLKLLMDAIFGVKNFRNEIVWKRTSAHNDPNRYGRNTDRILFYTKSNKYYFKTIYQPYSQSYIENFYRFEDEKGKYRLSDLTAAGIRYGESGEEWNGYNPTAISRHWAIPNKAVAEIVGKEKADSLGVKKSLDLLLENGRIFISKNGVPSYIRYLHEMPGVPSQELIDDISPISAQAAERLGYPTQKPEALIERIISANSEEGDLVLDPFCGCGTTIAVAERLHRRWIGIDITHLAITLMEQRLKDTFGPELSPFQVVGVPKDLGSAEALAHENRHQFEWWALSLVDARPAQDKKKGADTGIDGYIYFFDDESGKAKKIIVQVKSGHVSVHYIRDLKGVLEREKAPIGALITLEKPTGPMKKEATGAGFYEPEHFPGKKFPKMQILTIEELLAGKELEYPKLAPTATFKKAARKKKKGYTTESMFEEELVAESEDESGSLLDSS